MESTPPSSPIDTNEPFVHADPPVNPNVDLINETSPPIVVQTVERVITPIQPPVDPRPTSRPLQVGGLSSTTNPAKPTFAVLRSTTIQNAFAHPLNYARVLMQIGYEPLPAARGKNILGKESLYYPNVFNYMRYIYRTDGFLGLYRGFGYSLLSKVVCWYTTSKVDELSGPVDNRTGNNPEQPVWNTCIQKTLREIRCQSWGILISQPFQVMAIRCMGQFVGGENAYSSFNIVQNFNEIYNRHGIGGFFTGLIPRWLLEVSTIIITNVVIHLLKTQLSLQKEIVPFYEYLAAMVAQSATYPLSVVTTVTIMNRSGLRAATLPVTPVYTNWQDAYKYLRNTQQLKRGSSFFNRAALGTSGVPTPGIPVPNA